MTPEFRSKFVYWCPMCEQDLWTEKSERTNHQEWWFTKDKKRHFKNHCNFQEGLRENENDKPRA